MCEGTVVDLGGRPSRAQYCFGVILAKRNHRDLYFARSLKRASEFSTDWLASPNKYAKGLGREAFRWASRFVAPMSGLPQESQVPEKSGISECVTIGVGWVARHVT